MKSINLIKIQNELKVSKNQFNKFGNYSYRSQEDILEVLKPLLLKYECSFYIWDEIKTCNDIIYVEATAEFIDKETVIKVTAQAGIDINTKGMSVAQAFGASSSYARKYALGGLFLLDDSKDADATNTHGKDLHAVHEALNKLSGMKTKEEAIEWAKTLPDAVKTHETFRKSFSSKF
jgi:hypothetical protein